MTDDEDAITRAPAFPRTSPSSDSTLSDFTRLKPQTQKERMTTTRKKKSNQQIIVLDRGWVYVGHTRRDGDVLHITDARCIRRWGTTRGLGQLAAEGPTSDTVLDPVGTAIAPWHAVITLIECAKPW